MERSRNFRLLRWLYALIAAVFATPVVLVLAYLVFAFLPVPSEVAFERADDFNKKSCANIHAGAMADEGTTETPARCVTVYFATNRQVRGRSPAGNSFGAIDGFRNIGLGVFASKLSYGRAEVSMPHLATADEGIRKRGEYETAPDKAPGAYEELRQYVALTTITKTSLKTEFYPALHDAIEQNHKSAKEKSNKKNEGEENEDEESEKVDFGKQVLLFVHGYNVEFDDAVIRAAQLSVDLTFDREKLPEDQAFEFGQPVIFSWPNFGRTRTYYLDKIAADRSVRVFEEFLLDLASESGANTINIVVHSMGNRVLVQSLQRFVDEFVKKSDLADIKFRIVHAAADVDKKFYDKVMDKIKDKDFKAEYTIYASEEDRALWLSRLVNGLKESAGRLGQIIDGDIYIRETDDEDEKDRFTSIDATGFATDLFGHSYFSNAGNIIADISCYLEGKAPVKRALIQRSLIRKGDAEGEILEDAFWEADSSQCNDCAIRRARDFTTDEQAVSRERAFPDIAARGGAPSAQFKFCEDDSSEPVSDLCVLKKPGGQETGETPDPIMFTVYFDYKSTGLTDEARKTIAEYAQLILQYDIYEIVVIGYADTVGPEEYNLALSKRRADVVADALEDAGVPDYLIVVDPRGEEGAEDEALARRIDEGSDANRRRVEVVVMFE